MSSEPTSPPDFVRSRDLWFDDGSVVLIAEKIGFRVHKSQLALRCEFFQDMFGLPQPENEESGAEIYEKCPVVRMSDKAEDVADFLRAIYSLSTTPYTHIQNECGKYFALALETNIPIILPAVYFAATRSPLEEFLNGLDDASDMRTFVIGQERLRQAETKYVLSFLGSEFRRPSCQASNDSAILTRTAAAALRNTTEDEPYHQWCSDHPTEVGRSLSLCNNCCTTITNAIEEGQKKVWKELPGFFGLPDWEILQAGTSSRKSGNGTVKLRFANFRWTRLQSGIEDLYLTI
ncbi:hypothetical protein A0H81_06186 [Grifola frondosa]|uniref:BTB domain-containing protein n=1 Tax=Grifola frondosa TaxID=5627 RepID=A0A1C7MF71_GRIFR|nr:hypothetical protein A0H81_06186 [Grifola frondosa]